MSLPKDLWQDLENHPAWKALVEYISARIESKQHDLEVVAYRGDIIEAVRLSAEIKILRWVKDLPKTQQLQTRR